jgi:hypothetical protein
LQFASIFDCLHYDKTPPGGNLFSIIISRASITELNPDDNLYEKMMNKKNNLHHSLLGVTTIQRAASFIITDTVG